MKNIEKKSEKLKIKSEKSRFMSYKLSVINRVRILLVISICLIFSLNISAQNITVSGYVEDSETGEKLIAASVYELNSQKGTLANNFGFYSLTFSQKTDTIKLYASFIGYNQQVIVITDKSQTFQTFLLEQQTNQIAEVTVIAEAQTDIQNRLEMSVLAIPMEQIKTLPAIGGEVDVLKAIQLMPGVQSGGEGSSGIYVRGGSPDQNLIVLDDVPLYYVNHLGGFVSIFNADAINNFKLVKGGYPAEYGSRLSSVLDVRMKEGNMKKFQVQGTVGLISTKVSVEGPIIKDKASFIISARRFMLDLLMKPISKLVTDNVAVGYTFYDLNAKINYKLSDKNRLYLSFYSGDDKTSVNNKDIEPNSSIKTNSALRWGNMLGAFRWNHIYSSKFFSNLTLTYTQYRYLTEFKYQSEEYEADTVSSSQKMENRFYSGINDLSIKADFEYFAGTNYTLKFGAISTYHKFTPGITSYKAENNGTVPLDTMFNDTKFNSLESAVYLENQLSLGEHFNFNIGVRGTHYLIENKSFISLEPRLLANILITKKLSVKASYSQMQQNVHLLTYSGMGMPTDLWVPATKNVQPEKSTQYAAGFASQLFGNKYELSIEAYYKDMSYLIEFKEATSFYGSSQSWEDKVITNGKGISKGIEFLLQKKQGNFTGWLGYTLSKTTRQFAELNNGKPYNFRYDRTHDISIVANYKIREGLNISATWVYGTGNAITLANEYYKVPYLQYQENYPYYYYENTYTIESYAEKNSYRMRAFHKLDIGINSTKQKKWGERTWNFSIYNVYNRQNPYYYFFKDKYEYQNGKEVFVGKRLYQQSLFPIIPSISYSFKF